MWGWSVSLLVVGKAKAGVWALHHSCWQGGHCHLPVPLGMFSCALPLGQCAPTRWDLTLPQHRGLG